MRNGPIEARREEVIKRKSMMCLQVRERSAPKNIAHLAFSDKVTRAHLHVKHRQLGSMW